MEIFRADIRVSTDLALAPGSEQLVLDPEEGITVTLFNQDRDAEGWVHGMQARVVGPTASFDTAAEELQ